MYKIILIDNYDSFTYNLVQTFQALGVTVKVVKNNQVILDELIQFSPTHLLLGPGPSIPTNAGSTMKVLDYFATKIPILGVCLGHQAIGIHFGATLIKSTQVQHGKKDFIEHSKERLFKNLPSPLQVGRYHSLMLTDIPQELTIDAKSKDGTIMAISHKEFPIFGIQFHPESILSPRGTSVLSHFLEYS
jgi:anthranilate synthase/aminodeoxychorismate synthase-like glutamine amidotransferase